MFGIFESLEQFGIITNEFKEYENVSKEGCLKGCTFIRKGDDESLIKKEFL